MELECSKQTICNTCLSTDRDLYMIKDTLLPTDLRDIGLNKEQSKVCWECKAIIRKIEAFKQKALIAQQLLNNTIKDSRRTLSTLNIVNKDTYDVLISKNDSQFEYVDEFKLETEVDNNFTIKEDPIVCIKEEGTERKKRGKETKDTIKPDSIELDTHKDVIKVKKKRGKERKDTIKLDAIELDTHEDVIKVKKKRMKERKDTIKLDAIELDTHEDVIKVKKKRMKERKDTIKLDAIELDTHEDVIKVKKKRGKETKDEKDKDSYIDSHNYEDSLVCIEKKETEDKGEKDSDVDCNNYEDDIVFIKNKERVTRGKKRAKEKGWREGDGDIIDSYIVCSINEDELVHLRDKQKNSSVYRRAVFKCDTCILVFRSDEELQQHFSEIHSEILGTFVCRICEQRLPDTDAYNAHIKYHYNIYKCTLCKHKNYNLNRIVQHMKRNHSKEYSCTLCDITFNSKGAARYHIKTHNLEECKVCGRAYSDLKLHMISHNKMRTEECHICHKSLKSKSSLRFHLLTHTTPRKDEAYCAECDAQFKNKHIYRMHLKTNARHTTPDKECDYCHRKFISKFSLAKHISVVHYNKLDHICHLCGKKFSIAGHLRNHILIHHEGGSKPKKHVCDLCGKGFAIRKCLTDHMNSHTGARPYKCLLCPGQFGFKSALYMHNRLKHLKGKKGKKSDHGCGKNI